MEDSLSRSMFRLQAVGDNKSPSVEDSDDGLCDTKTPSAARARAPQSSRVKTRQEVVGVERVPPGVPGGTGGATAELPTARASSGGGGSRHVGRGGVPSTSQFLNGGRREQTLRMSMLVCRSLTTRTVTVSF